MLNCNLSPQDVTLQHYMDYTAESLIPVMAHIAKNVVKVNDGQTKHLVSNTLCHFPELLTRSHITQLGLAILIFDALLTQSFFNMQAIKGKYSTSKQMRIATISQLKSSMVKELAKQPAQ